MSSDIVGLPNREADIPGGGRFLVLGKERIVLRPALIGADEVVGGSVAQGGERLDILPGSVARASAIFVPVEPVVVSPYSEGRPLIAAGVLREHDSEAGDLLIGLDALTIVVLAELDMRLDRIGDRPLERGLGDLVHDFFSLTWIFCNCPRTPTT